MFSTTKIKPSLIRHGFLDRWHKIHIRDRPPPLDFTYMGFRISDYCLLILIHFNLFGSELPQQPVTGNQDPLWLLGEKNYGVYLKICDQIETSFFNIIAYINIRFFLYTSLYNLRLD